MMQQEYKTNFIEGIQQAGTSSAVNVGLGTLMCGCFFAAVFLFIGAVSGGMPWIYGAVVVVLVTGAAAATAVMYFLTRSAVQKDRVVESSITALQAEFNRKAAALELPATTSAAPALPLADADENDDADTSGEGEGSANLLHGFPPQTLMWVCDYLSNKNRWSEAALERMPVPHVFPPALFGKAEGNTVYNRLFHPERGVFCRAGIITGRGGEANATGKLAIASPMEMMERIKALPQEAQHE